MSSRTRLGWLAAALLIPCLPVQPARAQVESREGIALQNQILELRRDLDALRAQGGSPATVPYAPSPAVTAAPSESVTGDMTAQLLDRVARLEDEVRQLRGRIDEVDNARQRSADDLGKQLGDLQFRLDNGAAGPASAPPSPGSRTAPPIGVAPSALGATSGPPPLTSPPHRTPEVALQAGNAALAQRDYAGAEAAAREVLSGTHGPRTTDGQFLLAQALAGQRNYQAAAVAYDDTYNRNPHGNRAADSLLGLANALSAIGEKKAACETLDKLRSEFPSPRADVREGVATARGRAACH